MTLDSSSSAAVLFLGALAVLGLLAIGKLWRRWPLNPKCENGFSLLGRLSLSPQSRAYLVDVDGSRVMVVVAGPSVVMQVIGAPANPPPFRKVLEDVQR